MDIWQTDNAVEFFSLFLVSATGTNQFTEPNVSHNWGGESVYYFVIESNRIKESNRVDQALHKHRTNSLCVKQSTS